MWNIEKQASHISPDRLCWHLLNSIRSTDLHISELKWILKKFPVSIGNRKIILDRYENLLNMRFLMVYQFMDIQAEHPETIFYQMDPNYLDLKRSIHKC